MPFDTPLRKSLVVAVLLSLILAPKAHAERSAWTQAPCYVGKAFLGVAVVGGIITVVGLSGALVTRCDQESNSSTSNASNNCSDSEDLASGSLKIGLVSLASLGMGSLLFGAFSCSEPVSH
jgi:hypothetical protein